MKLIAIFGPSKGSILNLEEKEAWLIGRDPTQCNFVLDDSSVSRKHAKIYKTNEGYVIKNLSTTNPLEVNEEAIDEYLLEENDKIKIGDSEFLYTALAKEDIVDEFIEEEPTLEDTAEETIFEEKEEELPSPLIAESAFILKVISGPNAGSEFAMKKSKSYIIGKDTSADIIFTDLSVSKENTKISIDDKENIFVEDLNSKNGTYVNNSKIKEKTKISTNDLVTVGITTFLIVTKESAQETIYSPAPTFEFEEEETKKEKKKEKHLVWKKQFIPTRHLIFAGSFVLIFFVIFLSFFALFKAKDVEISKKAPIENIQKIIKHYEGVQFSFNPSSANLFLTGHVLTSLEKQEILHDLKQLNFIDKIEDNLIVDEFVWKDFNDTLNEIENFKSVTVHSPKAGNFILEGYVKNAADFQKLTDYVNLNFPYIDKLDNKVIIDQVLQVQIATQIMKNDFSGITFELVAGKLILAGRFDKSKSTAYSHLINEFKKTPGIHTVKNLAIPSSSDAARIDLTEKYKITGYAKYDGKNFSIIANGKIVTLGSELDKMLITAITSNTILLEKDDIKYKINYSL